MAERIVSLSVDHLFDGDHNSAKIPEFIREFCETLYSGDGKKPQMLASMGIDTSWPIRLLIGIPQKNLTRQQRLIAEAFCSHHAKRPLGDNKGLWTYRQGWQPANPKGKAISLDNALLDTEYMLSLGIPKAVWANDILMAPAAFDLRIKPQRATIMRYYLALAGFGFSDPCQFFSETAKEK